MWQTSSSPLATWFISGCLHCRLGNTAETDFHTLESCCLLRITPANKVSMHDQLRDLAYSIVCSEGDILQHSRWRIQDVVQGYERVLPRMRRIVFCSACLSLCHG